MVSLDKLSNGRTPCPHCGALLLHHNTTCRFCNKTTTTPPKKPSTPKKQKPQPAPQAQTTWEWDTSGKPITQGSGIAVATGVYKHAHAPELKEWRQAIEDAFREKYGPQHHPINQPVIIDAIFTVPRPKSHSKNLIYPTGGGDLDKLFRGAGDGISPRPGHIKTGKNRHKLHLQVIPDDNLIIELHAVKTYPKPHHTHPGALENPGVKIRVRLAPDPTTLIRNR